jgi:hypothetical protein
MKVLMWVLVLGLVFVLVMPVLADGIACKSDEIYLDGVCVAAACMVAELQRFNCTPIIQRVYLPLTIK